MSNIKHKCKEWNGDHKIHPDIDWLWGTHLECLENTKNNHLWALMDDTSGTFSIWESPNCPFCKIELKSLVC